MRKEYEIFLDGIITINPDEEKYLRYYLDKITYKNNVSLDNTNDTVLQCIATIVCHIVRKICKKDNPFINDYYDTIINMIDVDKITKDFISFSIEVIPVVEKYIKYADSQAEMTLIFANNYLYGLMNKLKHNPTKVKREIKLKKLNEQYTNL